MHKDDMANYLNNELPQIIKNYYRIIEEWDKNYDKLERYGKYDTTAPVIGKLVIKYILEYLQREGIDISVYRQDSEKINIMFNNFEKKHQKNYREKLYKYLERDIEHFSAMAPLFMKLDPLDIELDQQLALRDNLEFLLIELEQDHDLSQIKERVFNIDKIFKEEYIKSFEKMLSVCDHVDHPHFPDRFWWRHPSKILRDEKNR